MNQLFQKLELLGEDTWIVLHYISNYFCHRRALWVWSLVTQTPHMWRWEGSNSRLLSHRSLISYH